MKIIYAFFYAFLVPIWAWFTTRECDRCKKMFPRWRTYVRHPFSDFYFCGPCWREDREETMRRIEEARFAEEVERQRRIILARAKAEKDLAAERQPYRDEQP